MSRRLVVVGAPSSAGAYAPGQEKAPAALRAAGLLRFLSAGGITVDEKQGWDLYWVAFESDEDGGQPVTKPQYIYVERVYDRIPMAASLGFGG